MLDGYKTYLALAAAILVKLATWAGVEIAPDTEQAILTVLVLLAGIFMRMGQKKAVEKLAGPTFPARG